MKTPKIVGEARALTDGRGRKTGRVEVSFFGTFGISAIADNVDDATAACVADIERRCEDRSPTIVSHCGRAFLLTWARGNWERIRLDDLSDGIRSIHSSSSMGVDREKAIAETQYQLAQDSWSVGDPIPACVPAPMMGEFRSWAHFQTAMRYATDRGLEHYDAHNWACGSIGRPDLVERMGGNSLALIPPIAA